MSQTELLDKLVPSDWDSGKPGRTGFPRVRFLQGISDIVSRPLNNRLTASTNLATVNCTGATLSAGVGVGPIIPSRFAEFLTKARVTLVLNASAAAYVYLYRSTVGIPANGAAPAGGDVIVGGDAFGGGSLTANVNSPATLAFIDTGLNQATKYFYYFAINGPNTDVAKLINASSLMVSEF